MLILAIDTSGQNGSVALCRGDAVKCDVLGLTLLEGGTYSARLVPCIAELLQQAGLSKANIDAVAVVDGPGSFTGLRVGLSTAKALCEVLAKPLATVSMLEALALSYGNDGESVTAILDAGRCELYVGEYVVEGQRAELRSESISKLSDVMAGLPAREIRIVTTLPALFETGSSHVTLVKPSQADAIARIGLRKLIAGEAADPATLDANYIRRSDAELYSPAKH
jgi:tRNA threonylcarbamoyladenosine biosynthesis protein TsaB